MSANRTTATVRTWSEDLGEGLLDSPETPGGCWGADSVVDGDKPLRAGQVVHMEWQAQRHDDYEYVATLIVVDPALETAGG